MGKRGRKPGQYSYTKSELLSKLREATDLLGHSVSHREMRNLKGFPGDRIYFTRFGSWDKAKQAANIPLIDSDESARRAIVTKLARYGFDGRNKRYAPIKMRFKIFQRDNFTCQYCGRTPQNGAILETDHIVPMVRGGKTVFDNLITCCSECNIGKSDILLENQKSD